jgi:uncharacterized membrane protein
MASTHTRSWVKALTWRAISIIVTALIVYWFVGSIKVVIGVTVVANAILTLLYYLHERFWKKIYWGKC